MVARTLGRKFFAGGALLAVILAGTIVLTGIPAQAQPWHHVYRRTYIEFGFGPAVAPYSSSVEPCHTVVYPDGTSYSTCNSYYYGPGYTYYYGPGYNMYYVAPGYYNYGR
jgi:hypothetical protein